MIFSRVCGCTQAGRRGAMGGDRFSRFWMGKGEAVGVEMIAAIAGDGIGSGVGMMGQNRHTAGRVEGITREGMPHRGQMDADLVGATCGNRHIEQHPILATGDHLHPTFRGFPRWGCCVDCAKGGVREFADRIGDREVIGV